MNTILISILSFLLALTPVIAAAQSGTTTTTTRTTVINGDSQGPNKATTSESVTQTATTVTSIDDAIVPAVYSRFANETALIGTSLTVTSKNGLVTVSGAVTSQSQADAAMSAAQSVSGVKGVISNINVTTNPQTGRSPRPNY